MTTVMHVAPGPRTPRAPRLDRPFVPTSPKRPHWVLLGLRVSGVVDGPRPVRHSVLGTPLVAFEGAGGEVLVVDEACPHRGASLADGEVRGSCLVCPYHAIEVGMMTHPGSFYDYASLDGLVWLDLARRVISQHHPPPRCPPRDAGALAVDYETVVPVHPMAVVESLLGLPGLPGVARVEGGPRGCATWTTGLVRFEVGYEVPYTAWVVSTSCTPTGPSTSSSLWLTATPGVDGATRVVVRVSRPETPDAGAAACIASELGLWGDLSSSGALRGLRYSWGDDSLRPVHDALVREYRDAVRDIFPDLAAYWGLA